MRIEIIPGDTSTMRIVAALFFALGVACAGSSNQTEPTVPATQEQELTVDGPHALTEDDNPPPVSAVAPETASSDKPGCERQRVNRPEFVIPCPKPPYGPNGCWVDRWIWIEVCDLRCWGEERFFDVGPDPGNEALYRQQRAAICPKHEMVMWTERAGVPQHGYYRVYCRKQIPCP